LGGLAAQTKAAGRDATGVSFAFVSRFLRPHVNFAAKTHKILINFGDSKTRIAPRRMIGRSSTKRTRGDKSQQFPAASILDAAEIQNPHDAVVGREEPASH
jgi:hypothetical protein